MLHRAILLACVLAPLLSARVDEADDQAAFVEGLAERGMLEMTVTEAGRFLDEHARHAQAHLVRYRLASALQQLERLDEARGHFRALASVDGFAYRAESALRQAQCALAADALDEAAAALDVTLSAGDPYLRVPATFLLAEVDFRRDDLASAARGYAAVLAADASGEYARDAAAGLAWCASKSADTRATLSYAQQVIDGGAEGELAAEMSFLQGEAQRAANRPGAAVAAYVRVTEGPFADAALRGLAFAKTSQGDDRGAVAAWTTLLAKHPESRFTAEATLQLGIRQVQLGEHTEAERTLAAPSVEATAEARSWRARALVGLGRLDDALAMLDRADAAHPDATLAGHIAVARGDILTSLGRSKDAAAAYARAGSSDASHAAAVSSLNAGDAASALQLVLPLIAQDPDDARLQLTAAEALFALARYDDAEPHFTAAARLDESDVRARCASRLAWCRYLRGDAAGASKAFADVVRDHPRTPQAEEALFMRGRAADEAGDAKTAVAAWQAYVDDVRDGDFADEALLGLARLRPGEAGLGALERLIAEHAESALVPSALFERGERLSALARTTEAEACYAALVTRYPEHALVPTARYGLAWTQVEQQHFDDAVTSLGPLVAQPQKTSRGARAPAIAAPTVESALLASALELLLWCEHERQHPAEAEDAYRRLATVDPTPERVLDAARSASSTWVAAGRPELARKLLAELAPSPVGASALIEAAWIALDADDVDGAEQALRAAQQRAPSDDAVRAQLGELAFFVGEARFALDDLARAVPLYVAAGELPGEHGDEALYKLGFCALRTGEPESAAAALQRLVDAYPESPLLGESLFLLGEARVQQDRWEDALPPLRRVLAEMPRHAVVPKARFRLGLALCALKRWDAAEPVLADLLRDTPDFPNILESELWRGNALAALGRDRAARSSWQRVISDDGGVLAARARIATGRLDMTQGATEEALAEFLKVAVLYVHDAEVSEALLLAGDCLVSLGDRARAADRYREVLDDHPSSPFVQDARDRLATL